MKLSRQKLVVSFYTLNSAHSDLHFSKALARVNDHKGLELLNKSTCIRLVKLRVAKRSDHDDTKVTNQLNEDHF